MRSWGPLHGLVQELLGSLHRLRLGVRPEKRCLEGLRGPVEIVTDNFGVPHIHAEHFEDLFFAQGYVTARDRLFQMDYNRHGARGRLCELLGRKPVPWEGLSIHFRDKTTFDVDVFIRTFGLEDAAQRSLEVHSDEGRRVLDAYSRGVNARIAESPWTLEHRLLRRRMRPWTEVDSLVMTKAIGFELNYAWRSILLGAILNEAEVPADIAQVIAPHFPEGGTPIVGCDKNLATALAQTRRSARMALGLGNAPGVGSNSFAVAGSHTACGEALLANDTHL
ncbi:MAG: penicillin acylase family protein, partial [Myxococcota bacterium]